MAIEHPERVRSLGSIMSTTGNRRSGSRAAASRRCSQARRRPEAASGARRDQDLHRRSAARLPLRRGADPASSPAASFDRGHSQAGIARQLHAITGSGDRTHQLRKLDLPAVVIHGKSLTSSSTPQAGQLSHRPRNPQRPPEKMVEGMGHDLPKELWPAFVDAIAKNAERAAAKQPA